MDSLVKHTITTEHREVTSGIKTMFTQSLQPNVQYNLNNWLHLFATWTHSIWSNWQTAL